MNYFRQHRFYLAVWCVCTSPVLFAQVATAAEEAEKKTKPLEMTTATLARGGLTLSLPASWKAPKQVRSRIIEREYQIPAAEKDKGPGRLTMMSALGSVKLNVERWYGQFSQPDGKQTKDVAKVEEKEWNDQKITIVDIPGTFTETMGGGPFAGGKKVVRENYRMLGAIVQTAKHGQYFFKLYGPEKTVEQAKPGFIAMLRSVRPTDAKREN